MPRSARLNSESNIYHVMLRGINRQQIFADREDNEKFLDVLKDCKEICEFELFAYCLMGNHAHFLLKTKVESLGQIFKRIGSRYVYWYNCKYKRNGHLFQDRFKSEPIENDEYFLSAIRYIHCNPVKAGICDNAAKYPLSSYFNYISPKKNQLTDINFALELMPLPSFMEFHNNPFDDSFMEFSDTLNRTTDDDLLIQMITICNCHNASEFQQLEPFERTSYLKELKELGFSIRRISRLTGISKGFVERV